jgi:hypothetical protein
VRRQSALRWRSAKCEKEEEWEAEADGARSSGTESVGGSDGAGAAAAQEQRRRGRSGAKGQRRRGNSSRTRKVGPCARASRWRGACSWENKECGGEKMASLRLSAAVSCIGYSRNEIAREVLQRGTGKHPDTHVSVPVSSKSRRIWDLRYHLRKLVGLVVPRLPPRRRLRGCPRPALCEIFAVLTAKPLGFSKMITIRWASLK